MSPYTAPQNPSSDQKATLFSTVSRTEMFLWGCLIVLIIICGSVKCSNICTCLKQCKAGAWIYNKVFCITVGDESGETTVDSVYTISRSYDPPCYDEALNMPRPVHGQVEEENQDGISLSTDRTEVYGNRSHVDQHSYQNLSYICDMGEPAMYRGGLNYTARERTIQNEGLKSDTNLPSYEDAMKIWNVMNVPDNLRS